MEVWKMKNVRCMFWLIGMFIMVMIVSGCDQLLNVADSEGEKDGGLKFPTGSTTGTIYPLGAAMTDLWENELDDVQVSVQASNGGIDSPEDLKGKKFATGSVGSTPEVESSIILPEYGIDYPDDIDENFV